MTVCTRCLLDSSIPGIEFDSNGECTYCKIHDQLEREYPLELAGPRLDELIEKIKDQGKNRRYDCLIGISGGCDSSYLLHMANEWGLRPLAFHFDNNWNTSVAESNIQKMIKSLNVDFLRIGVNQKEYDDICRSFLLAAVPDVDIPNDIGIMSSLYLASNMGARWSMTGHSFRTEGTSPLGWSYQDGKYIQSVHDMFGRLEMKSFPNLWLSSWLKSAILTRVKRVRPLWFIDYQKEKVKRLLAETYDWEWYGGHHLENRYTIFCTNYYQPKKFGIDLRYIEYSAMVRSGQMAREEGLEKLSQSPEIDGSILREVKDRLGFTSDQLAQIMNQPNKSYRDYDTYKPTFKRWRWLFYLMSKLDLVPKTFYLKYTK